MTTTDLDESYFHDSAYYLKRRFSDPYDRERGVQPYYLRSLFSFYSQYATQWDPETAKLLEYGGGPVIYSLISAAKVVSEITFVDYLQGSLDNIMEWANGASRAHDWKPYIKYVLCELEGHPADASETNDLVLHWEGELRKKLTCFSLGDLREESGIIKKPPHKQFEVVSSNFCLEAVAKTKQEYQVFLEKLAVFVKPGGFLVSLVSLEESFWLTSKGVHSVHLFLTVEDAESAYRNLGFNIVLTTRHNVPVEAQNILNDCKVLYFIAAQKPQ